MPSSTVVSLLAELPGPGLAWSMGLLLLLTTAALGFIAGYRSACTAPARAAARSRRDVRLLFRATLESLQTAHRHCGWLDESEHGTLCLSPAQVVELEQVQAGLGESLGKIVRRQQALQQVLTSTLESRVEERPAELVWLRQPADPETGLPDASALACNLNRMLDAGRDSGRPGGLLLIQMDKAEALRSRYGASGADQLFRQLKAVVCRHLREKDLACRHSADVLAVLHPGPDPQAGVRAASAVRQAVRQAVYRIGESGVEVLVTASFGYAPCYPEDDAENVLLRAASALSRSQRLGRNQLHVFEAGGPTHCPAGTVL